ncbi:hypothetical protein R8871_00677 [Paraburkholderia graminis C4D1M]|nr:hypothetical protein R8871_00677 [Paraburkholderia graminis C4D1M]
MQPARRTPAHQAWRGVSQAKINFSKADAKFAAPQQGARKAPGGSRRLVLGGAAGCSHQRGADAPPRFSKFEVAFSIDGARFA